MNGDEHLSSHYKALWRIHQEIIFQWGVYTIFKWSPPDCRKGSLYPGLLLWMIPRACDQAFEIHQWLEGELEEFQQEPIYLPEYDHTHPGDQVSIYVCDFSGVEPYTPLEQRKAMAKQMAKSMMKLIEEVKDGTTSGDTGGGPPEVPPAT